MQTKRIGRGNLLSGAPSANLGAKNAISYVVPVIIVVVLIIGLAAGYFAGTGTSGTSTQVSTVTVTKSTTNMINPICVTVGNCSESLVYIPYNAHYVRYEVPVAPENITVVIGVNNTVMWMNLDTVSHTLTGSLFSIGALAPGATYSHTFTTPGVYTYSSPTYSYLMGSVTVVQSTSTASTGGSSTNHNY